MIVDFFFVVMGVLITLIFVKSSIKSMEEFIVKPMQKAKRKEQKWFYFFGVVLFAVLGYVLLLIWLGTLELIN